VACHGYCHIGCFDFGSKGDPNRCIPCRDTRAHNQEIKEALTEETKLAAWPPKVKAPPLPTTKLQYAIRVEVICRTVEWLLKGPFAYSIIESANCAERYLPDTILPTDSSRRMGLVNTALYFATSYAFTANRFSLLPYAPHPLAGRICMGNTKCTGMPAINLGHLTTNLLSQEEKENFYLSETIILFHLNTAQLSWDTLEKVKEEGISVAARDKLWSEDREFREEVNTANAMECFKTWLACMYAWWPELFSRARPCQLNTPTRKNKAAICELLSIQEYATNYDTMHDDANGEDRLDDVVKVVKRSEREKMFMHLFKEGYGLGTAGPTAQASTSKEVVGATGNAGVILQDKSSNLQDDQYDNNVAGTRNIACTTHILPAFSHPSCGPKSKREAALFVCGIAYPLPPARAKEQVTLSELIALDTRQIILKHPDELTPSARIIRKYYDPVVAKVLPDFRNGSLRNLPWNPRLTYHQLIYALGHADHTYTPSDQGQTALGQKIPIA